LLDRCRTELGARQPQGPRGRGLRDPAGGKKQQKTQAEIVRSPEIQLCLRPLEVRAWASGCCGCTTTLALGIHSPEARDGQKGFHAACRPWRSGWRAQEGRSKADERLLRLQRDVQATTTGRDSTRASLRGSLVLGSTGYVWQSKVKSLACHSLDDLGILGQTRDMGR
jgi:hypothetical protein